MELKARRTVRPGPTTEDILNNRLARAIDNATGGRYRQQANASGAAEAAGILTAVDEDPEGGEEADCPREFEYDTDAGEE